MTTISCFFDYKVSTQQHFDSLSHICFEKMPRSWEFTHNWHSLVLARSHPGANADDALKETLQPEEVCSNKFWKLRHYSYLFLLKSTFLRAPPCYCSSALLVSIFSLTYVHCSSSWRFSFEWYRNQMRCRINFNNKLFRRSALLYWDTVETPCWVSIFFFAERSTKNDNKCRSIYLFLVLSNKETYLAETFLSQLLLGSKCIKRN